MEKIIPRIKTEENEKILVKKQDMDFSFPDRLLNRLYFVQRGLVMKVDRILRLFQVLLSPRVIETFCYAC